MEDKNYKELNEDLNFDDILPPEDPLTPEKLARIKLPLNYETYLYLNMCGYTINNYQTLPNPLRDQFLKMEKKQREEMKMDHWD